MPPTESMEDYLKAIYLLLEENEYARTGDVGRMLDHKAGSVTEMFQRMADEGYIIYRKYEGARLTEKGRSVAEDIVRRHEVLKNFLRLLGLSEEMAEKDSCGIEHHLQEETLRRLTMFVEFIQDPAQSPRWLEHFLDYYEEEKE